MKTIYISCQEAKRLLGYKNHNSINYLVRKKRLNEYVVGPLKRKLYSLQEVRNLQNSNKSSTP
jgi:hypothetical protein